MLLDLLLYEPRDLLGMAGLVGELRHGFDNPSSINRLETLDGVNRFARTLLTRVTMPEMACRSWTSVALFPQGAGQRLVFDSL
jgi:hypothetical protein